MKYILAIIVADKVQQVPSSTASAVEPQPTRWYT